jgi:uncharacterized membrane-anchored protein YitT (DUF2179 family)
VINKIKVFAFNTLLLVTGSLLCAVAVKTILLPFGFLSSGVTGLSLIIYNRWQILPVGLIYFLINVPVFIAGFRIIGFRFIAYTAWGMVIYSAMLFIPEVGMPTNDKLLGAILAGGMSGTGVAIMLRSYGAAGGSEIICVMLQRLLGISLGAGSIFLNLIVLSISLLLFPLENVLYTFVYIIISARVTDIIFRALSARRAAMIISSNWKELLEEITKQKRWQVTLLYGKGGFLGVENPVLYSVVNRSSIPSLKALVKRKDPGAFITIMDAFDGTGECAGN